MSKSGKQYGLIMANKSQLTAPKASNIFGEDDDSDNNEGPSWVRKALKGEGEKSRVKKQTRLNMQKALSEDPTIYQYDEVYDNMEREKEEVISVKKENKKPKYINNLMKAAERRKRDHEQRIERMVQKEREEEGEKFADKESFVTAAYRAKLEEFKKMTEEEERMDRLESIGDVTKQQDMSGFYRQLFAQTVDAKKKPEETDEEPQSSREKTKPPNIDQDDTISTDSDSSDDANSDHSENQENINKQAKLPSRKSRQYRKRAVEVSESESEPEEEKEEEENPVVNDDNDNNKNSSDHEKKPQHEKESTKSPNKKARLSSESEEKVSLIEKGDSKTEKVLNVAEKKLQVKNALSDEIKEEIPEKKVSIWEKRTVGPVFDSALQRYYTRKSLRLSGC